MRRRSSGAPKGLLGQRVGKPGSPMLWPARLRVLRWQQIEFVPLIRHARGSVRHRLIISNL